MFKTLITTCLLTFSCSSGALPQEKDINIRKSYNSNNLSGCWCLKDNIGYSDWSNFGNIVYYDYESTTNVAPMVFYNAPDNSTQAYISARTIEFTWKSFISSELHINLGEESIRETIYDNDDMTDWYVDTQNCIVWFPSGFYVNALAFEVWTFYFSQTSNSHSTFYNGWYTFNNYNVNYKWSIYGDIIVNNNLYNFIEYYNGDCFGSLLGRDVDFTLIDNGVLSGSNAIYLSNVIINDTYYDNMTHTGVFDFVVQPVQYTFGDMIFNVIDAPIYMLSQLFDFRLFDIQFYVAFMGIVTVLLIGFIVRKLI